MLHFANVLLFSLATLSPITRAVETYTDNARYDDVNLYTHHCNMSSIIYDNVASNWVFTLDRSWYVEPVIVGNDTYYEKRSTEDSYWFYDNSNYLVNSGIFAFWSSDDFTVTTTLTDSTYLSQSVDYDSQSSYLSLQGTFYSKDNSAYLFDGSSYLFSCSLYGSESDYLVTYFVTYANSLDFADFNERGTYSGSIVIDSSNNTINVPYYNATNLTPNYVDNEILSIQLFIYNGVSATTSYTNGYNNGYSTGTSDGYDNGYATGYNNGYTVGQNSSTSFLSLLFAVADTPLYMLRNLFSVELFGVNVYIIFTSIITLLLAMVILKKVL